MDAERKAELRGLCEGASKGPWVPERAEPEAFDQRSTVMGVCVRTGGRTSQPIIVERAYHPDAAFIAASRTALPELLAEDDDLRLMLGVALTIIRTELPEYVGDGGFVTETEDALKRLDAGQADAKEVNRDA